MAAAKLRRLTNRSTDRRTSSHELRTRHQTWPSVNSVGLLLGPALRHVSDTTALVWVQTENSSLLAEAKDAIDGYDTVVHALEEQSLDEAESTALITRLYETLQPARDQAVTAETRSTEPFPPPA